MRVVVSYYEAAYYNGKENYSYYIYDPQDIIFYIFFLSVSRRS